MATHTPNLNLYKPDATDDFGDFRAEFNNNMDILDQGGGSSGVTDVEVNGTSVVSDGVAEVTVPTKTSDITNDSGFIDSSALAPYALITSLPTKVSDLTNDTGFITSTANNLTNYYKKSETYTQAEVDALISAIVTLNILVVQTLPTTGISRTTIYLVPKSTPDTQDVYDEYINLDGTSGGWEHIGTTQIDLSNYYTKTETNTLLNTKANTADLATVATSGSYNDLSDKPTIPSELTPGNGIDITNNVISVTPFYITGNTTIGFTPHY